MREKSDIAAIETATMQKQKCENTTTLIKNKNVLLGRFFLLLREIRKFITFQFLRGVHFPFSKLYRKYVT
jgi:hypothetical protein